MWCTGLEISIKGWDACLILDGALTDPNWDQSLNALGANASGSAWQPITALANFDIDFVQTGKLDPFVQRTLKNVPPTVPISAGVRSHPAHSRQIDTARHDGSLACVTAPFGELSR